MANLRNQMQDLAQGIATSGRECKMAVAESKAQTINMLQAFGRERAAMRHSLRRRLAQSTEATAAFVVFLHTDFAKRRAYFNKAYHDMAKAQRAGLAKDRRDRSRAVAELMNSFRTSRGKMARDLAESLAKSMQKIKSQVSGLNRLRASLEKIRKDAWFPRQIPNSLLAAQVGGVAPVPISALSREPDKRQKKTTVAKAVRAFIRKPGKPKKK